MSSEIAELAGFQQTKEALTQALQAVLTVLARAPYSDDPASPYAQAEAQQARIVDAMQQLAAAGVRQIDAAIDSSGIVDEIDALGARAEAEAARIADAAKTVDAITNVVDLAAGAVTKIAGLPFV